MNTTTLVGLCHSFAQTGLILFCQSGVIVSFGLVLSASLTRRGPLVQSLVYRATLIAVVLTAILSAFPVPASRSIWRVSLPEASEASSQTSAAAPLPWDEQTPTVLPKAQVWTQPRSDTPAQTSPVDVTASPALMTTPPKALSAASRVYITAAALWVSGTAGLLSWLFIGQMALLCLQRQGFPVTTGTAADTLHRVCAERAGQRLPLVASPHIQSPFLGGLRRPAIFIPGSYETDYDVPALRAIFTHEIVHHERADNWWTLLARLTCALFWAQPFLWLLIRRMEQASEEVCDGLALNAGCSPHAYAACLLSLAERRTPSRLERSLGTGMVPFRSQIGRRIQQILAAPRFLPMPTARFRGLAVIGTTLIVLLGSRLISSADPSGNASDVVGAYLKARALGQFPAAYGLLSRQTQQYVSLPEYGNLERVSYGFDTHANPYAAQDALFQLFEHGRVTPDCRYELIGPASDDPSVVLVRAHLPDDATPEGLLLRIATTRDSTDGGSCRLDMVSTLKPFLPDVESRLQARSDQKACALHLKQIGRAIIEYVQDHDEYFPHAAHWMDEIMPYVKDASIFHDPAAPAIQKYGYAFNRNLSGACLARIDSPAQVVLVFDSSQGVKNASDTGQSLPHPGRHTGGSEFLLADGHEKFYRDLKGAATFAVSGELPVQTPAADAPAGSPTGASGTITGRVVYEDGRPAAGVPVVAHMEARSQSAYLAQGETSIQEVNAENVHGVSQSDGSYRFIGLKTGFYDVIETGSGKWVASARTGLHIGPGQSVQAPDLVLTHGAVLTGVVRDKQTGKPIPDAFVNVVGPRYPASMLGSSSAVADRQGRYALRLTPGGNWIFLSGGYHSSNVGIDPVNTSNPRYPNYAPGLHVMLEEGQTKVVPVNAIRDTPPGLHTIPADKSAASGGHFRRVKQSKRKTAVQKSLEQQLEYVEQMLALSRQQEKSHALPSATPIVPRAARNPVSPVQAKRDFALAVHQHNAQVVAHWVAVARRSVLMQEVKGLRAELKALNANSSFRK